MAVAALIGLFGCQATPSRLAPGTVAALDAALNERFTGLGAPGAVYGLYEGPSLAPRLELTLGHADQERSRPIGRDDHFRIASVTKLFTGTVVLQLLDEGRLRLDDPVAKYVPGVPNGDRITIDMLGHHTSGLANVIANRDYQRAIEADPGHRWPVERILAFAFAMPPYAEPGAKFHYSNTNTIVLGEVIRAVTGHTWHEEVQRRIVVPLGLRHTGYTTEVRPPAPTPRGYRYGQKDAKIRYGDVWYDTTEWSGSWSGAAGDMYSTVDDLAVFTRACARGELLGAAGRAALFDFRPAGEHDKAKGLEFGFHLMRLSGCFGSLGDLPGASVFVGYLPDQDVTIVSLANLTTTRTLLNAAAELGELTAATLLGRPVGDSVPIGQRSSPAAASAQRSTGTAR